MHYLSSKFFVGSRRFIVRATFAEFCDIFFVTFARLNLQVEDHVHTSLYVYVDKALNR